MATAARSPVLRPPTFFDPRLKAWKLGRARRLGGWSPQQEIGEFVRYTPGSAVRSGHGLGKTPSLRGRASCGSSTPTAAS